MVGHDDVNCYCLQNNGPIVHGPPEPLYATPDLDTHIAHGVPANLKTDEPLFRNDFENPDSTDVLPRNNRGKDKKELHLLLSQLTRGTEQLLFSFLLPSTLSTTSNIVDLQNLVTSGCSKLQRKLLFADSLAKLPYKIGGIREVLTSMLALFSDMSFKIESKDLSQSDFKATRDIYEDLQKHTHGLCRGANSLPILAVELQNSCNLLQDAKVVTIFNMIAVPCFVYQGAVGLIGDLIQEISY